MGAGAADAPYDAMTRSTRVHRGTILRTHVLRPTWHFVTPADIRWMLALTGPRVSRGDGVLPSPLELDAAVFRRSDAVLARALRGGAQLTRQELKTRVAQRPASTPTACSAWPSS